MQNDFANKKYFAGGIDTSIDDNMGCHPSIKFLDRFSGQF